MPINMLHKQSHMPAQVQYPLLGPDTQHLNGIHSMSVDAILGSNTLTFQH